MKNKIFIIIGIVTSLVALPSCEDEPSFEDYQWATTDQGFLYSTNKSIDINEYNASVVGNCWTEYSFWRTTDLKDFGNQKFSRDMTGERGYWYFTDTECIGFVLLPPTFEVVTDAKWMYTVYPIERLQEDKIMRFSEYNLLGVRDGYLEMCRSTTTGVGNPPQPLYYYELYERCDGYNIDDIMASGIESGELFQRYHEWLMEQQANSQE